MKTLVLPSVTDLSHEFLFITKDELKYRRLYNKYKTKKGFLNSLVRVNDNYKQRSEKPDVHILEIELEWKNSRTWGYCPVASKTVGIMKITFQQLPDVDTIKQVQSLLSAVMLFCLACYGERSALRSKYLMGFLYITLFTLILMEVLE